MIKHNGKDLECSDEVTAAYNALLDTAFQEGLSLHPFWSQKDAIFIDTIQKRSKAIVEAKIELLSTAMGVPLSMKTMVNYETSWHWTSVFIKDVQFKCDFGLTYDADMVPYATVSMKFKDPLRNRALTQRCEELHMYNGIVCMDIRIDPHKGVAGFESALYAAINFWIELWTRIGGVNALSTVTLSEAV